MPPGTAVPFCTAAAAPLRRPANSRSPACGLQAATVSGAPPRRRAARHGFTSPAIAVPPAPTFALGNRLHALPAVCAASFARGFVGYLKAGLLAVLDCTQAGRG
ncbi:MAG: hypothetical protein ACYCWC_00895 [Rhodocyclaceae bacterium]